MGETQSSETQQRYAHERRDLNVRFVALCGLGLAVLLVGGLLVVRWLLDLFDMPPTGHVLRQMAPIAAAPPPPPPPRLQTSPTREMREMLRAESERLQSYAWVDRPAGIARLPIDQAMALVVQQGLPAWPEEPRAQTENRSPQPGNGGAQAEGGGAATEERR
jgi:hypothetical protein